MYKKPLAIGLIVVLILNMIFFAVGMIGPLLFWSVIIIGGIISYFGYKI